MKTTFVTFITEQHYHSMGCNKLVKSLKYFHPDIPIQVVYADDQSVLESQHPIVVNKFIKDYDRVVWIDADSIICAPLTELLEATNFDVVGVRNNNDFGKAGASDPIIQLGSTIQNYMNAGLISVMSKAFAEDWLELTLLMGGIQPFGAQSVLNAIKYQFKTKIIDPIDAPYYYGVSGLFGINDHWDSWKEITVTDGKLYANDKQIKVLHQAGGFKPDKLGYWMFSKAARERLIEICE